MFRVTLAYIGSNSGKKINSVTLSGVIRVHSCNKRAIPYVFPRDVGCLSGVFRVLRLPI